MIKQRNPIHAHSMNLNRFISLVWRLFFLVVGCSVFFYMVSENNLFVDIKKVEKQIQYEDASVRFVRHIKNNLFQNSVVTVAAEPNDKEFAVDAYYTFKNNKIQRIYKVLPINGTF